MQLKREAKLVVMDATIGSFFGKLMGSFDPISFPKNDPIGGILGLSLTRLVVELSMLALG